MPLPLMLPLAVTLALATPAPATPAPVATPAPAAPTATPTPAATHTDEDAPTTSTAPQPAPATVHAAIRIAVADLESKGVDAKVNKIFLDSLLAEVRKLQHASVIGMDEVRAMLDLEAQKQILGCGEEKSCLAEIAGAVGADVLIIGGLVDVGNETVLSLKRIDQKNAAVAQQVSVRLAKGNGEEVLAAIGPSVEKLFPDLPLRPGEKRGVSPEMALRLNPPPVPVWGFVTSSSIAVAALAGTAIAGAVWLGAQQGYKDLALTAVDAPLAGHTLKQKENAMLFAEGTMWTFLATTGAAAATTGAMIPFVDWQGYGTQP